MANATQQTTPTVYVLCVRMEDESPEDPKVFATPEAAAAYVERMGLRQNRGSTDEWTHVDPLTSYETWARLHTCKVGQ